MRKIRNHVLKGAAAGTTVGLLAALVINVMDDGQQGGVEADVLEIIYTGAVAGALSGAAAGLANGIVSHFVD